MTASGEVSATHLGQLGHDTARTVTAQFGHLGHETPRTPRSRHTSDTSVTPHLGHLATHLGHVGHATLRTPWSRHTSDTGVRGVSRPLLEGWPRCPRCGVTSSGGVAEVPEVCRDRFWRCGRGARGVSRPFLEGWPRCPRCVATASGGVAEVPDVPEVCHDRFWRCGRGARCARGVSRPLLEVWPRCPRCVVTASGGVAEVPEVLGLGALTLGLGADSVSLTLTHAGLVARDPPARANWAWRPRLVWRPRCPSCSNQAHCPPAPAEPAPLA